MNREKEIFLFLKEIQIVGNTGRARIPSIKMEVASSVTAVVMAARTVE